MWMGDSEKTKFSVPCSLVKFEISTDDLDQFSDGPTMRMGACEETTMMCNIFLVTSYNLKGS